MWEKDKRLVHEYRECMKQFLSDLKSGEEVDYQSACIVEAEKLTGYTFLLLDNHATQNVSSLSERKQQYYTPKLPFYQDL